MLSIIVLCIFLFFELFIAYKISKKELIPPEVVYILGFIPSAVFLIPFYNKWNVSLSISTLIVIIGGGLLFIIASRITLLFDGRNRKKRWNKVKIANGFVIGKKIDTTNFCIKKWKLMLCILFELVTIFLLFMHVRNVGGGASLSSMFFNYRIASTESYVAIPTLTQASRVASIAIGYVSLFVLLNKLLLRQFKRTSTFLLCVAVILGIVTTLMLANRGDTIKLIFAGVVQYLIISIRINNNRLPWKKLFRIGIGGIIFLLLFQQFGKLVGRTFLSFNIIDYIGIYLSAPIKNLDTYLNSKEFLWFNPVGIEKSQTLISITNFLAVKFNLPIYHSQYTEFGYQFVGNYELGNCYTSYAAYLYDFGYMGIVIYTSVMALISQLIYISAKRGLKNIDKDAIPISLIIYCILFFEIFFSFFSYTFYQNVFHIGFIRQILFMYLFKWFYLYL